MRGSEGSAEPPALTPAQWLRSQALALRFALSRRLRWRRPGYVENAVGELSGLEPAVAARVEQLRTRYGCRYERRYHRLHSLENYLYLDLLDRLRSLAGGDWPEGGDWLDVGSKHFWYAPVLLDSLRPASLVGVEIEGYRIYPDGHSRHDYAQYYLTGLAGVSYRVQDVMDWRQPVDGITCFYPFLLPGTVLAWGLPVSLLRPRALFAHLADCLRPGGRLLMVNQGLDEAARAQALAEAAGLRRRHSLTVTQALLPRPAPPVLSLFVKAI
ncbi:hypothetical protein ED208_16435 [Stagnimonas aquatica]|uniref:Class I SAM-dependent methyltransferase n=1 Tax=Stagnimonas aquatica TaxID=2689987 RepID=A0A3N0UZN0_9GAMM|nr:hypothetical protein [Stagnimonas aquatica]ROH86009.1 hypothetical protein ED208_16435 [Stagnimonas aquatica]